MQNPRLATRYAKSLLQLAMEQNILEPVYKDMLFLQSAIKNNRELLTLLRSPIVKADAKTKIINAVTEGRVNELTKAFTTLLITKGRERNLPEVINAFVDQYKEHKGIYTVKLTTAAPISEAVKQTIIDKVRSTSNMQQIEMETKVDEKLIGGFVLQAGDKLVDASIAYDLREIAKQFENNDFVYKVR